MRANELLGYPPDARLLILNADDFGMYQAINEAILSTLTEGMVRSTTLMAPCPSAAGAMRLLGANPGIAFGVHLTVIRDPDEHRYGPLTPREQVPSLIDEAGQFYRLPHLPELLARAKVEELAVEFRAQIEAVLAAGLAPTHLDWHCLQLSGRADIVAMTLGLAQTYGLAMRGTGRPLNAQLQGRGLPIADHDVLDSFRLDTAGKSATYARMLHELPTGLSEWAVHPGLGNAEARASNPGGWRVRQADFDFLISPEARELIEREGIIVLDYRPLQAMWRNS